MLFVVLNFISLSSGLGRGFRCCVFFFSFGGVFLVIGSVDYVIRVYFIYNIKLEKIFELELYIVSWFND